MEGVDVRYTPEDPALMDAQFGVESNHNPSAVGPPNHTGELALGIGQILPSTFKEFADPGMDILKEEDNKVVAKRYMDYLYKRYDGDIQLSLAAYNMGLGALDSYLARTDDKTWNGVTALMAEEGPESFLQTREYVPKILGKYENKLANQGEEPRFQYGSNGAVQETPTTTEAPSTTGAFTEKDLPVPTDDPFAAEAPSSLVAENTKGTIYEPPQLSNGGTLDFPTNGPNTVDEFNAIAFNIMSKPGYSGMPVVNQIDQLSQLYSAKKWTPETYDQLKSVATDLWNGATEEELPPFTDIVGVPPMIPSDENPDEILEAWKTQAVVGLYNSGVSPALYGEQLDQYLAQAATREKEAYTVRNRSAGEWALNRTGNFIRQGAKGATRLVTDAAAGAVRLGGAGSAESTELANEIQNLPEVMLGAPVNDFLYETDEQGYLKQNPDGSFQTHWQAQAAEGVGMIGAAIGTLGAGTLLGVSTKALAAANIGVDTLGMANYSFQEILNRTGDVKSAYTGSIASLPAAAIQSVGELGIVAGMFRPTLRGLNAYDQARFLAMSFTRNAAVGGATNALSDVIQQGGEISQTGEAFSGERTGMAAAIGAVGAGVAGTGFDYIAGRGGLKVNQKLENAATAELTTLRDNIAQEGTIAAKAEHIQDGTLEFMGMSRSEGADGQVLITKNTDIILPPDAQTPMLVDALQAYLTPDEILINSQRAAVLSEKEVRTTAEQAELDRLIPLNERVNTPNYLNNIKKIEAEIATKLEADPSEAPYVWRKETATWENVETGRHKKYLKDLLTEDAEPRFTSDVSDVSYLTLIDEDAVPVVRNEDIVAAQDSIDESAFEIRDNRQAIANDQQVVRAISTKNKSVEAATKARERLIARRAKQSEKVNNDIADLERDIANLGEPAELINPDLEATQASRELLPELENVKADILELRNELENAPDNVKGEIREQLRELGQQKRALEAPLLRKKEGVRTEKESLSADKATERSAIQREKLETRLARKQKELDSLSEPVPPVGSVIDIDGRTASIAERKKALIELQDQTIRDKITLRKTKKLNSEYNAAKAKLDKVRLKGLGAIIHNKKTGEVLLPTGLAPEAKAQVYAHEVAHALSKKIALDNEARTAMKLELGTLESLAMIEPASVIADRVLLPDVRDQVTIPKDTLLGALDKESRAALLSEREFLANQLGAIALKRAGHDIGEYRILPEIEEAVRRVNLPEIPDFSATRESPTNLQRVADEILGSESGPPVDREAVAPARDSYPEVAGEAYTRFDNPEVLPRERGPGEEAPPEFSRLLDEDWEPGYFEDTPEPFIRTEGGDVIIDEPTSARTVEPDVLPPEIPAGQDRSAEHLFELRREREIVLENTSNPKERAEMKKYYDDLEKGIKAQRSGKKVAKRTREAEIEAEMAARDREYVSPEALENARITEESTSSNFAEKKNNQVRELLNEKPLERGTTEHSKMIDDLNNLDIYNGELKETRKSRKARKLDPDIPPELYGAVSKDKALEAGTAFVDKYGIDSSIDALTSRDSINALGARKVAVADAILEAAARLDDDVTLNTAWQIANSITTEHAQAIAIRQQYTSKLGGPTESFAGLVKQLKKTLGDIGVDDTITEYMLKELRLAYKATDGLPPGVAQDMIVQSILQKQLANKKISWGEYIPLYMKANLLSGFGTAEINAVSGAWMGPLYTALANPFVGGGVAWKAIWSAQPMARAKARRVLQGKVGSELLGGLANHMPIRFNDSTNTATKLAGAIYNKFGRKVYMGLQAMDAYMRAITTEQMYNIKKVKRIKEEFRNNPERMTVELSKVLLKPDDLNSAKGQAKRELDALKLQPSDADVAVRAYEILRRKDTPFEDIQFAKDWTDGLSLRGEVANVIPHLFDSALDAAFWNKAGPAKHILIPFGKAMARLADMGVDLIPGHDLANEGIRRMLGVTGREWIPPKSAALKERARKGGRIGVVLASSAMTGVLTGAFEITTDSKKQTGSSAGKAAVTGKDFKEAAQEGKPDHSVIFPNGAVFKYSDFPGLSAILYGVGKAKEAIDAGKALPYVVGDFYLNAFVQSTPFLGDSTLSGPYKKLADSLISGEGAKGKTLKALEDVAVSLNKMITPGSSLLRDVKKMYDDTPEETNQNLVQRLFKDMPGIAEAVGSKPALDAFADPIIRTTGERIPGVDRIVSAVKTPSNEVWEALINKGIIVPELNKKMYLNRSDFGSEFLEQKYATTFEERTGKAYTNVLTPDEWYKFVQATGPHIKRVAAQIANSEMPTEQAQKLLEKRVKAIRTNAKKRYIRTGEF